MNCRFKEFDGPMLKEFVKMQEKVPDTFYNALLKENISVADILKINVAMRQFYQ